MFDEGPPPVMRGDLFALLDPDGAATGGRAVSPAGIAKKARRLMQRVELGERTPGSPVVMQCLEELSLMGPGQDPVRAFSTLSTIRQRLKSLGLSRSRGLPGTLVGERLLVLPQSQRASVLRVLPAQEFRVWYVVTREAMVSPRWRPPEALEGDTRGEVADSALGPARYERPEVTFRLFRFGEGAADIRLCMRVIQEPGSYCEARAAGDGRRVALLTRDVIGVFEGDGRPVLSGRLPFGAEPAEGEDARLGQRGAEVTALALDGDVLGLNMRARSGAAAELALVSVSERRGFPIGVVGEDADGLELGPKEAFIIDGVQLVRMPLSVEAADGVRVFHFRPWFAEYPWSAKHLQSWDGARLWLSNGMKIIVLDAMLEQVLAEIVLPEPILDFAARGDEVWLAHHDARTARLRVAHWRLAGAGR